MQMTVYSFSVFSDKNLVARKMCSSLGSKAFLSEVDIAQYSTICPFPTALKMEHAHITSVYFFCVN